MQSFGLEKKRKNCTERQHETQQQHHIAHNENKTFKKKTKKKKKKEIIARATSPFAMMHSLSMYLSFVHFGFM